MKRLKWSSAFRAAFLAGGWALAALPGQAQTTTPAAPPSIFDEDATPVASHPIPDKIEGFNRGVFKFNDVLYKDLLRPIGKGYAAVVPAPVRRGIGNFFHNLAFPTRFVGNVLEGRIGDAGTETERFVVNTVTTLGFYPTADQIPNLPEKPSDLGLAFGSWGIGHGTYLVLPVLGPSSVRDGVGLGISAYFLNPAQYLRHWQYREGAVALLFVNGLPDQMAGYDQLKAAAIDPYIALRDAYASQRERRVIPKPDSGAPPAPAAAATITP
jgi:phospholipid-binding lipoprotein MlaA